VEGLAEYVREPIYELIWNSRNVTRDVAPYVLSITYTDELAAKDDEINITFEDSNDRWKRQWYPQKGDMLDVKIGMKDKIVKMLNAGSFEIDELNFHSPPDTIAVRGISAYIKQSFRQKKTTAWENTTLSKIVSTIASRDNLTPNLYISPDIVFKRKDQKDLSDLAFLAQLASQYGYYTKIDHGRLIFIKKEKAESVSVVMKLKRGVSNIISYSFSDRTHKIYRACTVSYWNPKKKKKITYTHSDPNVVKGDILKIHERVENMQQAIERAKEELKMANRLQVEANITLMGEPYLTAGSKVGLVDFGVLSGEYLIEQSRHNISRSGYVTTIRARKC
jgi:phage protein D